MVCSKGKNARISKFLCNGPLLVSQIYVLKLPILIKVLGGQEAEEESRKDRRYAQRKLPKA